MSKSEIGRPFPDKKQDKGSRYTIAKIFLFNGILMLLLISYTYDNSMMENNVVFAQSDSSASEVSATTNTTLTDRSPSFLEAYWTDNSGSTSSSSTSM